MQKGNVVLCHERLCGIMQTCYRGGEWDYHLLLFENVMPCMMMMRFVLIEERCNQSCIWRFKKQYLDEGGELFQIRPIW